MKRFNTLLIIAAAGIMMSCGQQNQNTQQMVEENPKVTITTVNAEYVSQLSVYPTTVEADVVNNIAPQSAARISKINVEIGDKVNAGQTLAVMDKVNLEKARLQLINTSPTSPSPRGRRMWWQGRSSQRLVPYCSTP